MSTISQEESLLLQCLATTSLLGELSNANFLESDYYKQLSFSNKNREEGADIFLDYLSDQSKSMSVLYRTQIS